jgi:hypothetical protein
MQYDVSVGLIVTVGAPAVFKAKLTITDSLQWTNTSSSGSSSSSSESASITIGGPKFGYTGPTDVVVYWDTLYHSFMVAFPPEPPTALGVVTDTSGKPVVNKEVTLMVGASKFNTSTGPDGSYRFYGAPSGRGKVLVGATEFPVTVGADAARTTLKVP